MPTYQNILHFWFNELEPKDWYTKNLELDQRISDKFLPIYHHAVKGELYPWRKTIEGRLAEIIVLDQFPRNIFRNKPEAFFYDPLALILAQEASRHEDIDKLSPSQKAFLYMPYMHSESLLIHEEAIILFSSPGLEVNLDFELKHKAIIDRFGRYPHRNEVLGRESTNEEIEFLKEPGSSF